MLHIAPILKYSRNRCFSIGVSFQPNTLRLIAWDAVHWEYFIWTHCSVIKILHYLEEFSNEKKNWLTPFLTSALFTVELLLRGMIFHGNIHLSKWRHNDQSRKLFKAYV